MNEGFTHFDHSFALTEQTGSLVLDVFYMPFPFGIEHSHSNLIFVVLLVIDEYIWCPNFVDWNLDWGNIAIFDRVPSKFVVWPHLWHTIMKGERQLLLSIIEVPNEETFISTCLIFACKLGGVRMLVTNILLSCILTWCCNSGNTSIWCGGK